METQKLYRDYPYLKECNAQVISIGTQGIELNQTVFFAEAGGQVGDQGTIEEVPILDAQHLGGRLLLRSDAPVINVGTTIVHLPSVPTPFSIGDQVRIVLDWPRRYRIMRMHTAAHVVLYAALQFAGPRGSAKLHGTLKGCRIDAEEARFDFPAQERLNTTDLARIQDWSNAFLHQDFAIEYNADRDEPDLRSWRCGEIAMYCGGTHVRNTKEVGEIIVKRHNKGKGLERIYLKFNESEHGTTEREDSSTLSFSEE